MYADRVVSGMRPTGGLHLGHYHGVLKNWIQLQHEHECLFFSADWHALTTNYENPQTISQFSYDMIIDWLAAGVDPKHSTIFIQSRVPEHAELHLLLSMITPLGWLERVPTYKDQQQKLIEKDLNTYGFLGYPLLQSADVLIYRATYVPVGEDQIPHIEMTREIARRFNHLYGKEVDFEQKVLQALKKLGRKRSDLYNELRNRYQEQGDDEALESAKALLEEARQNISLGDQERLFGYLEGKTKKILTEPDVLLTKASKMPGLDGAKMSKSYHNTIGLRESVDSITTKVRKMPTDPARCRRTDAGNPEKCPVWQLHQVYSDDSTKQWVQNGCTSASIGCLECKEPIIDGILKEQKPMQERANHYLEDKALVTNIIEEGCERARKLASETLREVRAVMGLDHA